MNKNDEVTMYIENLHHSRKQDISLLREIVLTSSSDITEQIKWNAPSFSYKGEDRVTMRLQPHDCVQLVFHRGVKINTQKFVFETPFKKFNWITEDRGSVILDTIDEIIENKAAIQKLIFEWCEATK